MNKILLICLLVASVAFGQDTNLTITVDGVTYRDVRFQRVTPLDVTIFHSTGVVTIPLEKLPPDLQKRFDYDPEKAARWRSVEQKAAADAGEALGKTVSTVGWKGTIERVLADGLILKGCKITERCLHPVSIFLVGHPQLGELTQGDEIVVTAYLDGTAIEGDQTLEKWVYHRSASTQPTVQQPLAPPSSPVKEVRGEEAQSATGIDVYVSDPRLTGAFGFPEEKAAILCNRADLRLSVWSNDKYLFVQATLWKDNDSSVGKDANGDALGDYSHLMLDLDNNGKETPDMDRVYRLNQRPYVPGLHYAIWKENGAQTGDQDNSEGRGAIRYVNASYGKRIRVDTYLIPLREISKKVGDKIGICFYASSPKPSFSMNSVTKDDYQPRGKYQEYVLSSGGPIDITKVPDGRNDNATPGQ